MRRLVTDKLIQWKMSEHRKPLVLKGVRQCGKTYILREFGENHYEDVAYFNFEGNTALQQRFEHNLDVKRIILELGILRGKAIKPDQTLVIFDEVQFCNRALTSLKYFCENAPEYHIVCAGSLLGVALSKPLSFPVGKVDMLCMLPMSFLEFLMANDEDMLCDYLGKLSPTAMVSELFEEKLIAYLRNYYIVGGMPEVVARWLKNRDVAEVEDIQQRILNNYELDFAKHAPHKEFPKLTAIWHSIPAHLARKNSKFVFSHVKQSLRAKDLQDALEWLISAGLCYKVEKIEKPFLPLSTYADQTAFKLYMADIGLLRKMSGLPAEALLSQSELFSQFKGALTENYVLCELISLGISPYYWKSRKIAEVDFVAQFAMDIVPIEVKSEQNLKSRSLAEYRKAYTPRVAIKTSMANVSGQEVRLVPLYMLWRLGEYVLE